MFSDRVASISIAAALTAMVSIVAGGRASAQLQNTERELVDALQTTHRNAKEKKPKKLRPGQTLEIRITTPKSGKAGPKVKKP